MFQIVSVAIVCALIIVVLKSISSEYSSIAIVASGIILLGLSIKYLTENLQFFNKILDVVALLGGDVRDVRSASQN